MGVLPDLCDRLSVIRASADTKVAAEEFLALPDPSRALDRSYYFLIWQKTLLIVLSHLESAGADLDELAITGSTFGSTFPSDGRAPWDLDLGPIVTARQLVDVLSRHKRLLGTPVVTLREAGVDPVLLSGRAFEASFPTYGLRSEFDTDLLAPDFHVAAEIVEALRHIGHTLDRVRIRRVGIAPDGVLGIRRDIDGHAISTGIDVGGYYTYRGAIVGRARRKAWNGVGVLVPAPEDLLVMVAARVVRKQRFDYVHFNDVAVILGDDGYEIDWDLVCKSALDSGLAPVLSVLLSRADRTAVPDEAMRHLNARLSDRLHRHLVDRAASPQDRFTHRLKPWVKPRRGRGWFTVTRWRQQRLGLADSPWGRATGFPQRWLYLRQLRRVRSGVEPAAYDRVVRRLRPRCGSLCEVAPRLAASRSCMSQLGLRRSHDAEALQQGTARFDPDDSPHDCDLYRFDLYSGAMRQKECQGRSHEVEP